MLALRKLGYSYTVLADKYSVPKTTIRYLCRKFGLHEGVIQTKIVRQRTTTEQDQPSYTEEKINPGKTYAQYLKEEKERRWRYLTQK